MAYKPTLTVEDLQNKLVQEEDWLKEFEEALKRNDTLTKSVVSILDDFKYQITNLSNNVSTLYSKTNVVQREQQNVKKLLSIVDATIQFHDKKMDFENTIRDGNLLYNLQDYLEKMNSLKEAIVFFSSHSTYESQLNYMNSIFETGCGYLEAEFGNLVKSMSTLIEPVKVFDFLDQDNEILNLKVENFSSVKDTQKLNQMATWLLANTSCKQFLTYYANYRSENMLKLQKLIIEQIENYSEAATKTSKKKFIKSALKKAANKINEKSDITNKNQSQLIMVATVMLSATLAFIQIQKLCAIIFSNTKIEASVLQRTISESLVNAIKYVLKVLENYDGSFETFLPLIKFFLKHENRLCLLCENANESFYYNKLNESIKQQSVKQISNFIDYLANDHSRFIPDDGNVHHITSTTLNFLKILVRNRNVINYIYEEENLNLRVDLSKLFAQMLSALGTNLRMKANSYNDKTLGALFMFNNLSYINDTCKKDKDIVTVLESNNGQLLQFYQSEIKEYLNKYYQSWLKVTTILSAYNDEKKNAKFVYSNFNKEFSSIIDAQKNYCLVDISLAQDIRKHIKEIVLKPYIEFNLRLSRDATDFVDSEKQQLKYDAESVELIIDRLFDPS